MIYHDCVFVSFFYLTATKMLRHSDKKRAFLNKKTVIHTSVRKKNHPLFPSFENCSSNFQCSLILISSNFDGGCVRGRGEPQSLDHTQAISAKIRHSVITVNVTFVNHGEPSLILHVGTKPRLIYDIYGLWSELSGRAQPPSIASSDRPLQILCLS